jgi:hypothetical protein
MRIGCDLHGEDELEGGAVADGREARHVAAHELRQLPADGEAEAGAAVVPRRRLVALRKRLEQVQLHGLGNAGARVDDREDELTLSHCTCAQV